MTERFTLVVSAVPASGVRADAFLTERLEFDSRSQFQRQLAALAVNGERARSSRIVRPGDEIVVEISPAPALHIVPEPIEFGIVAEGNGYVVVNKPAGLVVHPGAGNPSGTLVNGLAWRYGGEEAPRGTGAIRPGIVHRLDKDTSGVMIVARGETNHVYLVDRFARRLVRKTYLAIVSGPVPHPEFTVSAALGRHPRGRIRYAVHGDLRLTPGRHPDADPPPVPRNAKSATTIVSLLRSCGDHALLRLSPVTGRTHQLRVHLAAIGCPILGDPLYGARRQAAPRTMLHAWQLELAPSATEPVRRYRVPVPPDFVSAARRMFRSNRTD